MKISKKRLMFPLLLAAAAAVFSGCSSLLSGDPDGSSSESAELTVFAAASLTEALEEIAEEYQKAEPDVSLIFNFDSSGTLKLKSRRELSATCSSPPVQNRWISWKQSPIPSFRKAGSIC